MQHKNAYKHYQSRQKPPVSSSESTGPSTSSTLKVPSKFKPRKDVQRKRSVANEQVDKQSNLGGNTEGVDQEVVDMESESIERSRGSKEDPIEVLQDDLELEQTSLGTPLGTSSMKGNGPIFSAPRVFDIEGERLEGQLEEGQQEDQLEEMQMGEQQEEEQQEDEELLNETSQQIEAVIETTETHTLTEAEYEAILDELDVTILSLMEPERTVVNKKTAGIKDPRIRLWVVNNMIQHGLLQIRGMTVLVVPVYIWILTMNNSNLQELVVQFSNLVRHESTRLYVASLKTKSLQDHIYDSLRYVLFLENQGISEIQIHGSLVTTFLQSTKISKGKQKGEPINLSTMETLVKAIRFLNKIQTTYKYRNAANGGQRDLAIETHLTFENQQETAAYIKSVQLEELENRKGDIDNDDDLGEQLIYDEKDLEELMKKLNNLTLGSINDRLRCTNMMLEMLLGDYLLLRGMNKRALSFRDLLYEKPKDNRPNNLRFRLVEENRYVSCHRHKVPELCLVGLIARDLWYRFDFQQGPLFQSGRPNFLDKESYYNLKLLYGGYARQQNQISTGYEVKLVEQCLKLMGKSSKARANIGRINGARRADRNRVPDVQIRRAGGWTGGDAMTEHYLEGTAADFTASAAGFNIHTGEKYFIEREHAIPPESLRKKIFPWLEEEKARFNNFYTDSEKEDNFGPIFFDMLDEFRTIILQDLVYIRKSSPESIFAQHPINSDPEFLEFESNVGRLSKTEALLKLWETPARAVDGIIPEVVDKYEQIKHMIAISQTLTTANVLSFVEDKLNNFHQALNQALNNVHQAVNNDLITSRRNQLEFQKNIIRRIDQHEKNMKKETNEIKEMLKILINSHDGSNHRPSLPSIGEQYRQVLPPMAITEAVSYPSNSTSYSHPPQTRNLNQTSTTQAGVNETSMSAYLEILVDELPESRGSTPSPVASESGNSKKRKLAKGVTLPPSIASFPLVAFTVPQLLKQWYHTSSDYMSVAEKDQTFGSRWRTKPRVKQAYFVRKRIITFIENIERNHESISDICGPLRNLTKNQIANLLEWHVKVNNLSLTKLASDCNRMPRRLIQDLLVLLSRDDMEHELAKYKLNLEPLADYRED